MAEAVAERPLEGATEEGDGELEVGERGDDRREKGAARV